MYCCCFFNVYQITVDVVTEHKKMSASLDKCPYCFSNIPKHLIIAIGMKVENYLAVSFFCFLVIIKHCLEFEEAGILLYIFGGYLFMTKA